MKKAILIIAVLTVSSCASIVSTSRYPVYVSSAPDQAEITIRNRSGAVVYVGKTPAVATLKSGGGFFVKEKYNITFTKDGFPPREVEMDTRINPWYFGNIIFGGLIGILIVDPITGAMWTMDTSVGVNLDSGERLGISAANPAPSTQDEMTQSDAPAAIMVLTLDQVEEKYRDALVPLM